MKLHFFNIDQKLHRIENMLDYEKELTDEQFRNTEEFLMEIKDTYDENHPNRSAGRIYTFLAHLYHHRMTSARYEEALDRYHRAEEIYKADHNEHVCVDHLHVQ